MFRTAPPETMFSNCSDSNFFERVDRTSEPLRVNACLSLVSSWARKGTLKRSLVEG